MWKSVQYHLIFTRVTCHRTTTTQISQKTQLDKSRNGSVEISEKRCGSSKKKCPLMCAWHRYSWVGSSEVTSCRTFISHVTNNVSWRVIVSGNFFGQPVLLLTDGHLLFTGFEVASFPTHCPFGWGAHPEWKVHLTEQNRMIESTHVLEMGYSNYHLTVT